MKATSCGLFHAFAPWNLTKVVGVVALSLQPQPMPQWSDDDFVEFYQIQVFVAPQATCMKCEKYKN